LDFSKARITLHIEIKIQPERNGLKLNYLIARKERRWKIQNFSWT